MAQKSETEYALIQKAVGAKAYGALMADLEEAIARLNSLNRAAPD